jgi:hypothetical protein
VLIRGDSILPMRGDTIFAAGDKVLAIARTECELDLRRELIGDGQAMSSTGSKPV